MILAVTSFFAGFLTILAPCVFPLLPIILGSSISGNYKKILRISLSLGISVFIFTILLRATTSLISIPSSIWANISGLILIFMGVITVFPKLWTLIEVKLRLSEKSGELLNSSKKKDGALGDILLGASLGPVFSSCSPTYGIIIATIFPVSFLEGTLYLAIYSLGLISVLFLIGLLGRSLTSKMTFLVNPSGIFKKVLGVIFILIGVIIFTRFDKQIDTFILNTTGYDPTQIEIRLFNPYKER